ncbi:BacL2 family protein [Halobacillus ihumii]|uniref:BacL2 family protein n=1 Tax=Halobacillus ihumii TaxID=2686092 RepID=UPI0013D7A68E|nr:BacL2 family protein [Halobacillus ihumii]
MERNQNHWTKVEGLAVAYYNETNEFIREDILVELVETMKGYVDVCSSNAVNRATETGVELPHEDFYSAFYESIWAALEAFEPTKGKFKSIVSFRFRIAEAGVWRKYQTKGNEDDKDGKSYASARWDSLDAPVGNGEEGETTLADVALESVPSVEETVVEDGENEAVEIIREYAKQNERYAKVIFFLFQGYEGEDLAEKLGYEEYDANLRQLVKRSKQSFAKFMEKRAA